MPKSREYFAEIENLDFIYDDPKKIDYFFAECAALAYKASAVAKREYAKVGLSLHFVEQNQTSLVIFLLT